MGKLKVIKCGPLASVQDLGRFGFRKYGIPQSGAMDESFMVKANAAVANAEHAPVVEFALVGLTLEALEETTLGVVGASFSINGEIQEGISAVVESGDIVQLSAPEKVYAYISLAGEWKNLTKDFDSFSTYTPARLGGFKGRNLKNEDILETEAFGLGTKAMAMEEGSNNTIFHLLKGPEWSKEVVSILTNSYTIDSSSNRMGIRLTGGTIHAVTKEIRSSATIPGMIQLPGSGQPIVLMKDCQTTGGYPRIAIVKNEELSGLAQIRAGETVRFKLYE